MRRSLWMVLAALVFVGAGVLGSIQAASETRVKITNGLGQYTIQFVYISSASSDSWGEDKLGSDDTIPPGQSRMWDLSPGSWDLRVKDNDGDTYTKRNLQIPQGVTIEWNVTLDDLDQSSGGSSGSLRIRNSLERYTIHYIYAKSNGTSDWGSDRLGSGVVLSPGEAASLDLPAGTYDLQVKDQDGDTYTKTNVRISSGSTYEWSVTLSDLDGTVIRIRNGLGQYTIRYVYISPNESSDWGEDKLGSGVVLRAGETREWRVTPGVYDLRVKDEDDDTYTRNDVTISRGSSYEWNVQLSDLD